LENANAVRELQKLSAKGNAGAVKALVAIESQKMSKERAMKPDPDIIHPVVGNIGDDHAAQKEAEKTHQSLTMSDFDCIPYPWASLDQGETWAWDDYFFIFAKQPITFKEAAKTVVPDVQKPIHPMINHYAISTFYRYDRNPHGPSLLPIIVLTIEQVDVMRLPEDARNKFYGKGGAPLYIGGYEDTVHGNLGYYEDELDRNAVRNKFFALLKLRLGLRGTPTYLGDLDAAYGHPETGLPQRNEVLKENAQQ
jgi:hypothetical protein